VLEKNILARAETRQAGQLVAGLTLSLSEAQRNSFRTVAVHWAKTRPELIFNMDLTAEETALTDCAFVNGELDLQLGSQPDVATATSWPVIQQVLRARNLAKLEHENQQAFLQKELALQQIASCADADTNQFEAAQLAFSSVLVALSSSTVEKAKVVLDTARGHVQASRERIAQARATHSKIFFIPQLSLFRSLQLCYIGIKRGTEPVYSFLLSAC
jgi:hypothetical protein